MKLLNKIEEIFRKKFISKKGDIIDGPLMKSNSDDLIIYVGPTREITSLEEAISIANKTYTSNGNGIVIFLDPYQEDGITQAVYEISDNIQFYGGFFKIISYLDLNNKVNIPIKPKIVGINSQTFHFTMGPKVFVSFENIEFENITFISIWNSIANLVWCNINITSLPEDIKKIFLITAETFSLVRLRGCNLNGILFPEDNIEDKKTIALNCQNGSYIFFDNDNGNFSTINNFNYACYCYHGSYINAQTRFVNIINVNNLSTPAINTIGNSFSYVER